MPSVFTIEGTDIAPAPEPRKRRGLGDAEGEAPGENCKLVKNTRTGCEVQLCQVPKSESRTGWKFMKGTSRCPVKQR